ncbi:MAG TPA: cytochrome c biogenesis protein ResB [Blastocatellia bacterium]|nr:cytochrome c biogenesis protein ResB [Blastocatellia bacterium]
MENLNQPQSVAKPTTTAVEKRSFGIGGFIDRFLAVISSVPFGIILLVILLTLSMIGMLIQQQELDTFANYFASLTPAEKLIYGRLGFFNIYHASYFNFLLLLLSLNIILASIDYFPKAWKLMRRKKLTASPGFTQALRIKHEPLEMPDFTREALVERAKEAARALKYKVTVTDKDNRTTIFGEKGAWNRMGAYAVHLSLLTIFAGGMLTSLKSQQGGMWVQAGTKDDKFMKNVFNLDQVGQQAVELPFTVECLDIRQTLVDKTKSIDSGNTIDWFTKIKITDKETGKVEEALIHMNKPHDWGGSFLGAGYRMFQASTMEMGSARSINLKATPTGGGATQDVQVMLNGEANLADGSTVRYIEFVPDFQLTPQGQVDTASGEYNNPAAHIEVVKPDGEKERAWVFTEEFQKQLENNAALKDRLAGKTGFNFLLKDFEKASQAHMLSIQYDPGANWFYLGSAMLCTSLLLVFFFSHQRLWIVCEEGKVFIGGDANRNRLGFEDRIKQIAARIKGVVPEPEE